MPLLLFKMGALAVKAGFGHGLCHLLGLGGVMWTLFMVFCTFKWITFYNKWNHISYYYPIKILYV